jgi:sec-independent protein translocase protein TatA
MLTNILQPTHPIIVLVVALLILGPKRLPEAGRALGQGLKEFRGSFTGAQEDPPDHIDATAGPTPEARRGRSAAMSAGDYPIDPSGTSR